MPKKKTGARKKAEKQKERQRGIREARDRPITDYFCNVTMVSYNVTLGVMPRAISCVFQILFLFWCFQQ